MEVRKLSANLDAKKQIVEDIKAKIQASKSVILIDYKGLTVAEDTEFRCNMRKSNTEYKVLKNTLLKRAFNELNITAFDEDLNGSTSVAFGVDETQAAKVASDKTTSHWGGAANDCQYIFQLGYRHEQHVHLPEARIH